MSNEQTKAAKRRFNDGAFHSRYFVGNGIDIGGAPDPLSQYVDIFSKMVSVKTWDIKDGDAQILSGIADGHYDFLHSSHCLEHLRDIDEALFNWIRVVRPGGYLVITIPDEDLYELGYWPSKFNPDHKWTFTIHKLNSWSPNSINIIDVLKKFSDTIEIEKIELQKDFFRDVLLKNKIDQTQCPPTECSIEIILRKRNNHHSTKDKIDTVEVISNGRNLIADSSFYQPLFSPWRGYGDFKSAYDAIKDFTIVSPDRAYIIWVLVKQAMNITGQIWECGTYKGGTALLMSNLIRDCQNGLDIELHLFDTFQGIPTVDGGIDLHSVGDFNDVDIQSIKKRFVEYNFVNFHIGEIPASFDGLESSEIIFAHIDVDVYQSVMDCCFFIYPKLKSSGIMIFDDYGFPSCPGARLAVDEFFSDKSEEPLVLPTGQAIVFKI